MKHIGIYLIGAAISLLALAGCGTTGTGKQIYVSPSAAVVTPDSMNQVNVDAEILVPGKAFTKRSRLIILPQVLKKDTLLAEGTPIVLDAPVFSKKNERRILLDGYRDSLAGVSQKVDNRETHTLAYKESLQLNVASANGARVVGVVTTDGCGECSAVDTLLLASVSDPVSLVDVKQLKLDWIEPEFVIRPKIVEGRGEAHLQFAMNKYDINMKLGRNETEMNGMLGALEKILADSLATLNKVEIYGMASADGSFALNTTLARNRASSAKTWLLSRLGEDIKVPFSIGSRPEGWIPVLNAMTVDGHPDSLKVKEIIERYKDQENDDTAERYIRRLSCWSDIRARYLQSDRKVEYVYTYTLKSFTTDAELLTMYDKRPDAFNEEELLRVSTLKQSPAEKKQVYETILHYFPQSQVAANNLAVLLLREGKTEEADAVLDRLKEYSPEMLNTKAAIYIYREEYEKAVELLSTQIDLPQARYNLALIRARERKLDEAYSLMEGYRDVNAAVIALSVNRNDEADEIMKACEERTPLAAYVRALVAARLHDAEEVKAQLAIACTDHTLKERAKEEPDFDTYRRDGERDGTWK